VYIVDECDSLMEWFYEINWQNYVFDTFIHKFSHTSSDCFLFVKSPVGSCS